MRLLSKNQNKNGFSIIEVIVAIGIIVVGIIPIISLFNQNLRNEIKNKNILIATYLANESIEIVRQQRDNNWFKIPPDTWMTDIPVGDVIVSLVNSNDIREGWTIETPGVDKKRVYLSSDGSYIQSNGAILGSWEKTPFERYLTINTGTPGCLGVGLDCMEVTSHVLFNGTQIVKITTYLYNGWK